MDLNEFSEIIRDKKINEDEKLKAFNDFYDYYSQLVKSVLGNKRYTERQLSVDIFRKSYSDKQSETVFKKQLFSSYKTLERIKKAIETGIVNRICIYGVDSGSINNFSDFLSIFSYDVYSLVEYAEYKYNNNILNFQMGSYYGSSSKDIFENGSIILHINHFGTNSIHFRDFFSYTVFTIRLLIEVAGKKILGFNSITDDKDERIKNLKTQIAWEFIKFDQLNGKRIVLPMEIDTILEIEKWTNRFIHTGQVQPIFLVENALVFLENLKVPKSTKISEYNTLKLEFEEFLTVKVRETQMKRINSGDENQKLKEPQTIRINWGNESQMESKIISR